MSDAPERIWATHDLRNGYYFTASGPQLRFEDVEYVRADRIEELEAKLAKATDTLARIVRGDDDAHNWAIWTLGELKGLTGGKDE